MHSENDYEKIAKEALSKYSIIPEQIVYLGKSDNGAFRVNSIDEASSYLIKLHYSTTGSRSKEHIESELIWLEVLARDSSLVIPVPVKNSEGELVTTVWMDGSDEHIFVTVHSWVQGELLHRQPTAEETQRLALLMADLHEHSKQWVIPDSFRRPEYDLDNLLSSYRQLRQQLNGLIREEDFYCLEAVVGKICVDIAYQERTPDKWGIIHSDLHEGNYVFYSDSPRPIDFSNCGYGYYLFDIAETFMHLSFENQKVFISTYGSVHQLQDDYIKVIEAFFIWSIIRTFAFHSLNPNEHKALTRDLPFVIQNYCKKYLADENMLLY